MPVASRPIITSVTPQDYNLLRADMLDPDTGHNHDGVTGARINHSHLIHPANYSPLNTHAQIDAHIAADKGVHGAAGNLYVVHSREKVIILNIMVEIRGVTNGSWRLITVYFDPNQRNVFADEAYAVYVSLVKYQGYSPYRFSPPIIDAKNRAWVKIGLILDEIGSTDIILQLLAIGRPDPSYNP